MRARDFILETDLVNEIVPVITRQNSLTKAMKAVKTQPVKSASTIKPISTRGTTQKQIQNLEPKQIRAADRAVDKLIRPGTKIPLPSTSGKPEQFKIVKIQGNDVEIENPEANKDLAQPKRLTYKKDDIKKSIAI